MKILEKVDVFQKVLQGILLKKRFPLAIMWSLTYRCNLQCIYCGVPERKTDELDTASILSIIDEASKLGVKFITFSGGEPLLREDLPDIINFCKRKRIQVLINSNGTLIKKEFWKIKDVDEIQVSLDGPRHINDAIRGRGVYDKVIEAVRICKANNINVLLNTVISKQNISYISYILDIAREYKVEAYFQPVTQNLSHNSSKNIRSLYGPEENDYKKVISSLIEEKRKGNKFIKNSIAGLRHLYRWPHPHDIGCLVSLFFFTIEPDGKIFICDCFPDLQKYLVRIDADLKKTFNNLHFPHPCRECWSGSLPDINLFKTLSLDNILNLWKRFIHMVNK